MAIQQPCYANLEHFLRGDDLYQQILPEIQATKHARDDHGGQEVHHGQ